MIIRLVLLKDCGTTLGERCLITPKIFSHIVGAYYINDKKESVLITREIAHALVDTVVTIRKPHCCLFRVRGRSFIPCSKCYAGMKNSSEAFIKHRNITFEDLQ